MKLLRAMESVAIWATIVFASQGQAEAAVQDRSSPFCSYRNYQHIIPTLLKCDTCGTEPKGKGGPVVSTIKTIPGRIGDEVRKSIRELGRIDIGRDELGRHDLYVPLNEAGESHGVMRVHSEPGDYGLVFVAVLLDTDLRLHGYQLLRYRGSAKAWMSNNDALHARIHGTDVATLRSWLDKEGTSLSAKGIKSLGLEGVTDRNLRTVIHVLRISIKVIYSTDMVWGPQLRKDNLIRARKTQSAESPSPTAKD